MRRWNNDDGTLHVAELSISGALFHIHEEKKSAELIFGTILFIVIRYILKIYCVCSFAYVKWLMMFRNACP